MHVSTSDLNGGAARAAYRIYETLAASGADSRLRVLHRASCDPLVVGGASRPTFARRVCNRFARRLSSLRNADWSTDNPVLHSFGKVGAGLVDELNASDADVLNLHWVSNTLSISDIGRLNKPLVWTLHDMWAFCGGEHYAPEDPQARFRRGYLLGNRPDHERGPDLNRRAWEAKQAAWRNHAFTLVSPSRWLGDCAQGSVIFADAPVHVIPNPLDVAGVWQPMPADVARTALRLPLDKKLLLMGAHGGTEDPRKGGDLLCEAVERVVARLGDEVELVIYGQGMPSPADDWPCPVHWLGVVKDDRILAQAYAAVDVMVVPSRQDNLPNAATEAQACGTPVVAFEVGGLPDIVVQRETGWLAPPFDTTDMAEGIVWILADANRAIKLRETSREAAVDRFSPSVVARRYLDVYSEALSAARRQTQSRG